VNPIPDPLLFFSGSAGNRTRASGSVAKNSDHVKFIFFPQKSWTDSSTQAFQTERTEGQNGMIQHTNYHFLQAKLLATVYNIAIESNTGTTIEVNALAVTPAQIAE
jgi:hypothetical protein